MLNGGLEIRCENFSEFSFYLQKDRDEEFEADDDEESDVEETIEEQEKHESADYNEELDDLKNEGKFQSPGFLTFNKKHQNKSTF